jgi:hypothetical protein
VGALAGNRQGHPAIGYEQLFDRNAQMTRYGASRWTKVVGDFRQRLKLLSGDASSSTSGCSELPSIKATTAG